MKTITEQLADIEQRNQEREATLAPYKEEARQSRWEKVKEWFSDHPEVKAAPVAPTISFSDADIIERHKKAELDYKINIGRWQAEQDAKVQASVDAAILAKRNGTWVEPVKEADTYAHLPKCQMEGCKIPITGVETLLISRNGEDLFQKSVCPGCEKKLFEAFRKGHAQDLQSNRFAKAAVFFTITSNGSKGFGRPASARQGE